jgi:thioredoxin-like negative regulator of GroEL
MKLPNFSNTTKLSISIVVVLIIVLIILYICQTITNKKKINLTECNCSLPSVKKQEIIKQDIPEKIPEKELERLTEKKSQQKNKLCLYYADWCTHCKNFMPEWEKLKSQISSNPDLNNKLEVTKYNCENNKDICSQANVRGYPTVILHKYDGADYINIEYNGRQRESQEIINFINSNLV